MNAPLWNELVIRRWQENGAPAIVDDDTQVSGDQLLRLAAGAAALLDDLGFRTGAAVPLLMDENVTSIAIVVGGALSKRPVAPLGTKLPATDLAFAVDGLAAHRLLVSPERLELGRRVAEQSGVELIVISEPPRPAEPVSGKCAPDDVALIIHTSGTTGRPRPVYERQAPLGARISLYQEVMGIGPGDLYCSASPFYHTAGAGMTVTVLPMGVAVIPMDWFSIENWRRAGRLGATCILLVPTMLDILRAEGALNEANPRVLQYGGMPIHPDILKTTVTALPSTRMLQIFGQTEASPISFLNHEDHLRALRDRPDLLLSVGRAIRGTELRVENPDEEGIGEIALRAAHAFQVDEDSWRRTGDLGVISDEGYLYLHGRVNDRIIRGGENIYPSEIETELIRHARVRDAAVVGVPDRKWGEVVKAVIVPTDQSNPPSTDELRTHLADRVAHFKLPAVYEFVSELPRNPNGKILRRQLRQRASRG